MTINHTHHGLASMVGSQKPYTPWPPWISQKPYAWWGHMFHHGLDPEKKIPGNKGHLLHIIHINIRISEVCVYSDMMQDCFVDWAL